MTRYFHQIPIGNTFSNCGNLYRKRSSRTADMIAQRHYHLAGVWTISNQPVPYSWFYFRKTDVVDQESHWWNTTLTSHPTLTGATP